MEAMEEVEWGFLEGGLDRSVVGMDAGGGWSPIGVEHWGWVVAGTAWF